RGWTQAQLAERAGISRTAVTAIEGNLLVPSVAAALALAEALETSVEAVFGRPPTPAKSTVWAKEPAHPNSPYWHAEVAVAVLAVSPIIIGASPKRCRRAGPTPACASGS
ncbi:MAG TPA: helix-turn-helix transcriptional regulator, partial [Pirellulales bacterium]|nr:helix-turn-helix transcriptional regulator [Pirellulales bacterium]